MILSEGWGAADPVAVWPAAVIHAGLRNRSDLRMDAMHPAIAELEAHRRRFAKLSEWLRGADFGDERGSLDEAERARFTREREGYVWTKAELEAHMDRVALDHPGLFERWRKASGLRPRPRPRWRLDRVTHPPRGDLFELEQRVTWRVTEVATGRVALEAEGSEDAEYEGPGWTPSSGHGVMRARVEGDEAVLLLADGRETRRSLVA